MIVCKIFKVFVDGKIIVLEMPVLYGQLHGAIKKYGHKIQARL